MSTRSGKRIHQSFHENVMLEEGNIELKAERKTRSRRLKENLDSLNISLPKVKKNYVSYPSTEEEANTVGPKTAKTTRKQTLKEINNREDVPPNCINPEIEEENHQVSKPTRNTRKTKAIINDENTTLVTETQDTEAKRGTKNKKKTQNIPEDNANEKENALQEELPKNRQKKPTKTKKNGKKKISNVNSFNSTASSVESYHTAAGSPVKNINKNNVDVDEVDCTNSDHTINDQTKKSKRQKRNKKAKKNSIPKISNDGLELVSNNEASDKLDHTLVTEKKIEENTSLRKTRSSIINTTLEKPNTTMEKLNGTAEKCETLSEPKVRISKQNDKLNSTFEKETDKCNTTFDMEPDTHNTTFDKYPDTHNTTFDKELDTNNTTFDKSKNQTENAANITFDKSDESITKISLTSDDSKSSMSTTENILNTTPVLIESSMDCTKTPEAIATPERTVQIKKAETKPLTPLKREGTFTKDGPDPIIIMSPKPKLSVTTPSKRQSMPSPGRTPYHSGAKNDKSKVLNRTHSVEKPTRRSMVEPARTTRVMFCSPVKNAVMASQRKSRVIKSSMKGSNKSFLFDDSVSLADRSSRKRSFAASEVEETRSKRTKLADEMQESVDRLSRPRSNGGSAKPATTPALKPATSTTKSDTKSRSKLPNFAALHQRQFARMESLDECQERKAKRAQRLLVPVGGVTVLERSSPKLSMDPKSTTKEQTIKKHTTNKPVNEPQKTYTRFGFKLNLDVNPFSIPSTKNKDLEKMEKPCKNAAQNYLNRSVNQFKIKTVTAQPSIAGATTTRKEEAKQKILREKSSTTLKEKSASKRIENRTIIKGVRTNRRFELQMKSRNVNGIV